MSPPWVYEGTDGALVLYNGVTRATRITKLAPGSTIRVEVIGTLPKPFAGEPSSGFLAVKGVCTMVTITFADRETEKRALAFLLGRFSGRVLRSGEHLVPEAALEALADQNIPFTVQGKATYEQQVAAIRGDATPSVQ
jgi:hypothetical protein